MGIKGLLGIYCFGVVVGIIIYYIMINPFTAP
jgi:hypothetical protein